MNDLKPFRINDDLTPPPGPEPNRFREFIDGARLFVWRTAGKSPEYLEQCSPITKMKATATGMYLCSVVPAMAFIAMNQFLKPVDIGPLRYIFAAGWAVAVVLLDRLVLLFQTGAQGTTKWVKAGLRFAGSAITGFLVTESIIVMLFSSSIDRQIRVRIDTQVAAMEKKARGENTIRRQELLDEKARLQDRLDGFRAVRDDANRLRNAEADGEQPGHPPGEGQHYERRKGDWERASSEYDAQRAALGPKLIEIEAEIGELDDSVKTRARLTQEAEEQSRDFLSQHEALFAIIFNSPSALLMYTIMFLGIGLIETAPLLNKVVGNNDEHDKVAAEDEKYLSDERKLSDQVKTDSIKLERDLWYRISKWFRDGQPDVRPSEMPLAQRTHGALIANLLGRLFGPLSAVASDAKRIAFRVVNHPEIDLQVIAGPTATLMDYNDEIEHIANGLPQNGHGRQQFVRAESSLGREIWVHEALAQQVESDGKVLLIYGHPLAFGATE